MKDLLGACWRVNGRSLRLICYGQSIALSLALVSSASSTIEAQFNVVIPVTMSGICYLVLSLHLVGLGGLQGRQKMRQVTYESNDTYQVQRREDSNCLGSPRLQAPWWNYMVIAFLDVQANYVFMQSFRYTSLTSAQLLSSLAVPSAMTFSKIILNRQFQSRHFLGAVTCILGGIVMVWSDLSYVKKDGAENDGDDARYRSFHPNSAFGDLFAIIGACLYGLTDTIAEHFVKNGSRTEYLGMMGLFGAIISFVQALALEWPELQEINSVADVRLFLVIAWYVVCLTYCYMAFSRFLEVADVTLLILSLQTSQLWVSLFSVVVQNISPLPSFYVAVVLMVCGVFIYEAGPSETNRKERSTVPVDNESPPRLHESALLLAAGYGSTYDMNEEVRVQEV